jgi:hypothetical protein
MRRYTYGKSLSGSRIRAFDALSSAVTAFHYPTSTGRLQQPPQTGELRNAIAEAE